MGLMDKVKAQATQVAARAQEAGKVGQAKIEALQAKRKADALLEELGKLTFEAHAGRAAPGADGRIADIFEQLRQYEAEFGPVGTEVPEAGPVPVSSEPGGTTVSSAAVPTPSEGPVAPAAAPASAPVATPAASGGLPTASYGESEL